MGEGWRLMGLRHEITKAWGILVRRLRQQGLGTTLQWVWGRGWPKLTGVPIFKSSRITPEVYVGAQFNRRGRQALLDEGLETAEVARRLELKPDTLSKAVRAGRLHKPLKKKT